MSFFRYFYQFFNKRIDGGCSNTRYYRYICRALVFGIILTQVIIILIRMQQKSNYYVDELYSMGYAHLYTSEPLDNRKIDASDDWQLEKWLSNSVLKDRLVVSKENSLLNQPFLTALKMLLTRRSYHGMLNLVMSIFIPGKVGKVPGIIMNIFFFVFTQLLLYQICMDLMGRGNGVESEERGDKLFFSAMVLIQYGFCSGAVSSAIYIRFYSYVTFLFVVVLRIHQIIWNSEKISVCFSGVFCSLFFLYHAMKNSELVFILGGTLIAAFSLGLIIRRQSLKAACYCLAIIPIGLFYVIKKTFFMKMLLHPEDYLTLYGPQGWMTRNLLTWTMEERLERIAEQNSWIAELLFGSWVIMVSLFVIAALLIYRHLFIYIKQKRIPGEDAHTGKDRKIGFIWILFTVEAVYMVFAWLTGLERERYLFFIFPLISIVLWRMIDYLSVSFSNRRTLLAVCSLLAVMGIIMGLLHPERISFIYKEDRPFLSLLSEVDQQDVVEIYSERGVGRHALYECVNLMSKESRILFVSEKSHSIDVSTCPKQLLIWIYTDGEVEPFVGDLITEGYSVSKLGSSHTSDVYTAVKE